MRRTLSLVGAATLLVATGASAINAQPTPPNRFFGTATLNGATAPDGTTITARVGSNSCGTGSVSGGSYMVDVAAGSTTPGCASDGATVTFLVGTATATQTGTFQTGAFTPLNLTAGGAAQATATATAAATRTATPTATVAATATRTATATATATAARTATATATAAAAATPVRTATAVPTAAAQRPAGPAATAAAQRPAAPAAAAPGAAGAGAPAGAAGAGAAGAPAGAVRLPATGTGTSNDSAVLLFGALAAIGVLGGAGALSMRRR